MSEPLEYTIKQAVEGLELMVEQHSRSWQGGAIHKALNAIKGLQERVAELEAERGKVRNAALEQAARIAGDACLVPPDGGSPTEGELAVATGAAEAIRSLKSQQLATEDPLQDLADQAQALNMGYGNSEGWKLVSEHGNPAEGLYLAIYKHGGSIPVALLSYGDYEYRDEDDGEVQGFGWHETIDSPEGDSWTYVRDVIAYLPTNYDIPSLAAVRTMLTSPTAQQQGEQP